MTDINDVVQQYWAEQPHPQNPALKVGEYANAVKLATHAKFGGHASPQEAGAFWGEFQAMNQNLVEQGKAPVSPEQMKHLLDQMAPVSFAFHGRPPTMAEIAQHRDSPPEQVRKHYAEMPDTTYPHVPAGGMVAKLQLANNYARMHLGRSANKLEASQFYHGQMGPDQINAYYQQLKSEVGPPPAAAPAATPAPPAPSGGASADPSRG